MWGHQVARGDCVAVEWLWGDGNDVLRLRGVQGHRDGEEGVLKQVVCPMLV